MSKRYVLVHDCGYVVNPGDEVVCTDANGLVGVKVGKSYAFRMVDFIDSHNRRCSLVTFEDLGGSVFAYRFNCTVMELDDE